MTIRKPGYPGYGREMRVRTHTHRKNIQRWFSKVSGGGNVMSMRPITSQPRPATNTNTQATTEQRGVLFEFRRKCSFLPP